ncbi:hypothetical protein KPZU09_25540 [Klebsiella pneumoniae]|uniref:Uncharacterized protein n=1 Tax=Klebsiella pneumoniae TaxID=573 RepID=A0A919HQK2_KLEPN|nr:hypothetical protein KPZU09_25540 [Klebsiella pneumoniae]
MIARIWSGESPLWRLLLPLSAVWPVSGVIRLSYRLGWQKPGARRCRWWWLVT